MECKHKWVITLNDDNMPEDIMCEKCCEVFILIDYHGETFYKAEIPDE